MERRLCEVFETGDIIDYDTRLIGLTTVIRLTSNLHCALDLFFRVDGQGKESNHAAKNSARMRKIGLNLLKKDKSRYSLRSIRLGVGWSNDYLIELLKF